MLTSRQIYAVPHLFFGDQCFVCRGADIRLDSLSCLSPCSARVRLCERYPSRLSTQGCVVCFLWPPERHLGVVRSVHAFILFWWNCLLLRAPSRSVYYVTRSLPCLCSLAISGAQPRDGQNAAQRDARPGAYSDPLLLEFRDQRARKNGEHKRYNRTYYETRICGSTCT